MKRARKAPNIPLAELRFRDLVATDAHTHTPRQVNLKVPPEMFERVHEVASLLAVSQTATIIALLNEGLQSVLERGLVVLTSAKPKP